MTIEHKKKFTSKDIENLFVQVLENELKLEAERGMTIFYSNLFEFQALDTETMDTISRFNIRKVLDICNTINSQDDLFENEEDLLVELNELFEGESADIIVKHISSKYPNITFIKSK